MEEGRRMGGRPSRRREAAPLTATARDLAPPSLRILFSPNHRHNSRHHHGESHRTSSPASHEENGKRTASSQEPASPLTLFSLRSPSAVRLVSSPASQHRTAVAFPVAVTSHRRRSAGKRAPPLPPLSAVR
nr:hypothetical protein Iba_scaffold42830CG0010 [Ipomoea batatas]GMD81989.1 hypothetical protein Iba_chr13fCG3720 [Ipomoea batatas]